jgi:hypothetical protein
LKRPPSDYTLHVPKPWRPTRRTKWAAVVGRRGREALRLALEQHILSAAWTDRPHEAAVRGELRGQGLGQFGEGTSRACSRQDARAVSVAGCGCIYLARRWLLPADVGYLPARQAHQIGCFEPHRSVVRAGLEHDRVACSDSLVHDHLILAATERRNGAELEVCVVAREVVLAR